MVTKRVLVPSAQQRGSVLAKIQMVTKRSLQEEEQDELFCSSKNSDGNKTFKGS